MTFAPFHHFDLNPLFEILEYLDLEQVYTLEVAKLAYSRVPRLVAFFGPLSKSSDVPTFSEELILLMRSSTIFLVIGPELTVCPSPKWLNRAPSAKIHVK